MQFNRKIRKVGNSYMITVPVAFIKGNLVNTETEYIIEIKSLQ